MTVTRRSLCSLVLIPALLLTQTGCTTPSVTSIAVGLLDSASAVLAGLVSGGEIPTDAQPWASAASAFMAQAATELSSTDPVATEITVILADARTDLSGVSLPSNISLGLTIAVMALTAFENFIKSQQATAAVARAVGVKESTLNVMAKPSSADKAACKRIIATQRALHFTVPVR